MQPHPLAIYWQPIASASALVNAEDGFARVLAAYSESQRAYHTLQHLEECFSLFDAVKAELQRPELVQWMIWFHDIVYDPKATDNEYQSAEYAKRMLGSCLTFADIDYITQGILATALHDAGQIRDYQYLMDIDLAILGANAQRFAQYEAQIRHEYSFVAEVDYLKKRADVLRYFEAQKPLYKTAYFQQRFEDQAKHNLRGALAGSAAS